MFLLVLFVAVALFVCMPRPLPTTGDLAAMPWWAPLGGIVGAVAVCAGPMLIQTLAAGPVNGVTISANLIASLAIDRFALFGMAQRAITRLVGAVLMIVGVETLSASARLCRPMTFRHAIGYRNAISGWAVRWSGSVAVRRRSR